MSDRSDERPPGAGDPAPADARPHPPWPVWKRVLASLPLAALALLYIWHIDRQASATFPTTGAAVGR